MSGLPPVIRTRSGRIGAVIMLACCLFLSAAPPLASEEERAIFKLKLEDLDGEEMVMRDLLADGGMVLFDFWATWCKPCQMSLPEMQGIYDEYSERGLTVIGISVDGPRNFSKVRPFAARYGLEFPNVIDTDGNLQRAFKVTALPTSILIDSSGEVVKLRQGYRPGEGEAYAELVDELLPPAPADSLESSQEADNTGAPSDSS